MQRAGRAPWALVSVVVELLKGIRMAQRTGTCETQKCSLIHSAIGGEVAVRNIHRLNAVRLA